MIVSRLQGGLGNQMFQFAYSFSLAKRSSVELKFDVGLLIDSLTNPNAVHRRIEINKLGVELEMLTYIERLRFAPRKNALLFERAFSRILRGFGKVELRIQKGHAFEKHHLEPVAEDTVLAGRWQDYRYFKDQEELIRNMLVPSREQVNQAVRAIVDTQNSEFIVAIHVRRGDYVTHPLYSKVLGALDVGYYQTALERIEEERGKNQFKVYVVSDDPAWCKENLKLSNSMNVIESSDPISDLYLLIHADAAIISNSTFGWWGGFLGSKDRMVFAPANWSMDPDYSPERIQIPSWISVDNGFDDII